MERVNLTDEEREAAARLNAPQCMPDRAQTPVILKKEKPKGKQSKHQTPKAQTKSAGLTPYDG